ncbi:MAG TPA: MarR family winged helix-turn-helix transcriptional regulator [Hyphomicrobiales bacterium]|nr:MarR family winged helix-turn-helix transcriptional regulator [Hyphomicrobiales bacterium]
MTPDRREDPILFFIHRLSRSILRASMARYTLEFDLGVPQVQILNAIGALGPRVSKDLADYMAMNKALVSRSLSDLTARGYTRNTADPNDARRRVWTLTAKGRRLVEICRPIRHERTSQLTAALTDDERAVLVDILHRLYAASEQLGADEAKLAKRRRAARGVKGGAAGRRGATGASAEAEAS